MLTHSALARASSFRTFLGIAIFILLFGGGAFAVMHTARIEKIAAPKIAAFFESYFALIENKELAKAWETRTSQHYKDQYPLASYQGAWNARFRDLGRLTKREIVREKRTIWFGRSSGWTVVADFTFEKNANKVVSYYLAEDANGELKIDLSVLASGRPRPIGEPW